MTLKFCCCISVRCNLHRFICRFFFCHFILCCFISFWFISYCCRSCRFAVYVFICWHFSGSASIIAAPLHAVSILIVFNGVVTRIHVLLHALAFHILPFLVAPRCSKSLQFISTACYLSFDFILLFVAPFLFSHTCWCTAQNCGHLVHKEGSSCVTLF